MAEYKVTQWEAQITHLPGRYTGDGPEIIRGTLRTLECYIRNCDDRVLSVTLLPIVKKS
jgi:hypothetical protein